MTKFTFRSFAFLLFFFLLGGAVLYNFFIYKNEHYKALQIVKGNIVAELKSLKYTLSLSVERNGIESSMELVDSLALLNPLIESISISDESHVLLSSKRKYIQKDIKTFSPILYKDFEKINNFEFEKVIQINLKTFSQNSVKHYFIFVELDQKYVQYYLNASVGRYLLYSLIGSLVILFIIFYWAKIQMTKIL